MDIKIIGIGNDYLARKDILKSENVLGLFDNNIDKIGTYIDGICIEPVEHITKGDVVLISTSKYKYQLTQQLLRQGVRQEDIKYLEEEWINELGANLSASPSGILLEIPGLINVFIENGLQEGIFKEIFVNECYNFNFPDEYIVIDIGQNVGFASFFFSAKENVKRIYGYEPDAVLFTKLQRNMELNPRLKEKIEAFPYALGSKTKSEKYTNVKSEDGVGGIRKIREGDDSGLSFEIHCVDVAEEMEKIIKANPGCRIVLKSDCEGAEYDIFERLEETGLIENVDAIVMEWHLGKRKELESYLSQNRYSYIVNNTTKTYGLCYAQKCRFK